LPKPPGVAISPSNAILQDPLSGELIDPFEGRRDFEQHVLRAVSMETFAEDSLRVLRAAQFAARFQFEIDPGTIRSAAQIDLSDLPGEGESG
jgi:tRNA nucleotidyltransferase (CCA-adding enzyme)